MTDARPYAKAPLDLLRGDLAPSVKLVAIAVGRMKRFGETPTTRRLIFETALPERTVQRAMVILGLAAPRGRPRKTDKQIDKQIDKQTATVAIYPPVYNSVTKTESRESGGGTAPPPSSREGPGKKTATAPDDPPSLAAAVAARLGGRFPLPEVAGHVASQIAAGLYAEADLAAWLAAGHTAAYPSYLKAQVPAFVAALRAEAFAMKVRQIRAGGLTRAQHRTAAPPRRAEVRLADDAGGLLILEELVGGRPGTSAEALGREIAAAEIDAGRSAFHRDAAAVAVRRLRARLAAVLAGDADPQARPPDRRRLDIRTPEALAEWRFEAEQPFLPGIRAEGP